MQRLLVLAVLAVIPLAACEPTGHPRCDNLLGAQRFEIEARGWLLRCDPPASFHYDGGYQPSGWTDHKTRTVWLWPDRIPDDRVLIKTAWHELGHIVYGEHGYRGTQADEERWADGYAWCREPIFGISYLSMPTGCETHS